ncbi:hypothetical protein N8737_02220 [Verrucomicrobia bacterium]|nr:hypothetical protein [Verrucomicrobiota bacterium]
MKENENDIYDSEFKSRVAQEALKGERAIQQISKAYEVHPVQVSEWKKRMAQGAPKVFETSGKKTSGNEFDQERDNVQRKIGQLSIELDRLQEKSKQLCL